MRNGWMAWIAAFGLSLGAQAADLEGRVVGIADGDTLTVLAAGNRQVRVRLAEIDAPESPGQPFNRRATQRLSELCAGKTARVVGSRQDRYGRTVGTVYCDGVSANADLVQQGLAWVYVQHAAANSPLYALEREARAQRRGLWADPNPVPPWEYRAQQRATPAPTARAAPPTAAARPAGTAAREVRGNRNSRIYHLPHCPSFNQVAQHNRVPFASEQEAQAAGYRRAGNCR